MSPSLRFFEFHGLIGIRVLSLTPRSAPIRSTAHTRYSFFRAEFINPLIIEDLEGWISDSGDQVVAVNVPASNTSNRYFGEIAISPSGRYPIVSMENGEHTFSYQYIGSSFSGVHVLRTWSSGEGTGVFCSIILVTLSAESAIEVGLGGTKKIDRFIVKKIASVPLGDRYEGDIGYRLGLLTIGKCKSMRSLRTKSQHLVVL